MHTDGTSTDRDRTVGDPDGDVFRQRPASGPRRPRRRARLRREAGVLLAVFLGGGLGSVLRYAVSTLLPTGDGFPWSTFIVNATGCVLIGVLMVCVTEVWRNASIYARPLLGIGVLGGLTTYSTMMLDLRTLGSVGDWLIADLYLAASLVVGLAGVWIGIVGTRVLHRRRT